MTDRTAPYFILYMLILTALLSLSLLRTLYADDKSEIDGLRTVLPILMGMYSLPLGGLIFGSMTVVEALGAPKGLCAYLLFVFATGHFFLLRYLGGRLVRWGER